MSRAAYQIARTDRPGSYWVTAPDTLTLRAAVRDLAAPVSVERLPYHMVEPSDIDYDLPRDEAALRAALAAQ